MPEEGETIIAGPGRDAQINDGNTEQGLAEAIAAANSSGSLGSDVVVPGSGEGDSSSSTQPSPEPSTQEPTKESIDWKSKYEELASKSQDAVKLYETLEADPGAVEALTQYYSGSDNSEPEPPVKGSRGKDDPVLKELDTLRQQLAAVTTAMQVQEFARRTPDFDAVRPTMHKLSQKYPQLDLDDLYKLAKVESGRSPKPLAGAEGGSGGGSAGDAELEAIRKRIVDAKSTDDAVALAALYHQKGGR